MSTAPVRSSLKTEGSNRSSYITTIQIQHVFENGLYHNPNLLRKLLTRSSFLLYVWILVNVCNTFLEMFGNGISRFVSFKNDNKDDGNKRCISHSSLDLSDSVAYSSSLYYHF